MKKDNIIILICILLIVIPIFFPTIEKFQRMNYLQMHNYLDYTHGNGIMRHGFDYPLYNTNKDLTRNNESEYNTNEPELIGYIYSQEEDNNDIYQLYEAYDYKRGRPGYAYKDSKYQDNRDSVLVTIEPDMYDGNSLYDGDIINAGFDNQPYIVKLYEIKSVGLGTRYANKDYNDGMEKYGLLRPVIPTIDMLEEDKYYILYRQTLDPRRSRYNYYIKDKRGSILELDDQKYKDLYEGDELLIPGKEKYGLYVISNVYENMF